MNKYRGVYVGDDDEIHACKNRRDKTRAEQTRDTIKGWKERGTTVQLCSELYSKRRVTEKNRDRVFVSFVFVFCVFFFFWGGWI